MSLPDELERLAKLKASGALSEEEFTKAKAALLSKPAAKRPEPSVHYDVGGTAIKKKQGAGCGTLAIALGAVLVLAVIAMLFGPASDPNAPAKSGSRMTASREEAWIMSKAAIRLSLKAPSTAEFCDLNEADGGYCWRRNDGLWESVGWVDAQNAFSAQIRTEWRIIFRHQPTAASKWLPVYLKIGSHVEGEYPEDKKAAK